MGQTDRPTNLLIEALTQSLKIDEAEEIDSEKGRTWQNLIIQRNFRLFQIFTRIYSVLLIAMESPTTARLYSRF